MGLSAEEKDRGSRYGGDQHLHSATLKRLSPHSPPSPHLNPNRSTCSNFALCYYCPYLIQVAPGAHKCCEAAPRSVQQRRIARCTNHCSQVMALFGTQLQTAATEATEVYNSSVGSSTAIIIWSMTERSKFPFRSSLFSAVGRSLAPLRGAYGLLVAPRHVLCKCCATPFIPN